MYQVSQLWKLLEIVKVYKCKGFFFLLHIFFFLFAYFYGFLRIRQVQKFVGFFFSKRLCWIIIFWHAILQRSWRLPWCTCLKEFPLPSTSYLKRHLCVKLGKSSSTKGKIEQPMILPRGATNWKTKREKKIKIKVRI